MVMLCVCNESVHYYSSGYVRRHKLNLREKSRDVSKKAGTMRVCVVGKSNISCRRRSANKSKTHPAKCRFCECKTILYRNRKGLMHNSDCSFPKKSRCYKGR